MHFGAVTSPQTGEAKYPPCEAGAGEGGGSYHRRHALSETPSLVALPRFAREGTGDPPPLRRGGDG
jgi:hypothetical protein